MKDSLANALSYICHPLLMPTLGVTLLFSFDDLYGFFPAPYKWFNFLVVFIFTFLIPLLTFLVLKRTGQISDFNIRKRQERILPIILTLSCYLAAYVLLLRFKVPVVVHRFVLAGMITIFVAGVVTLFWKISVHMTGIGGFAGAIFMLALILELNLSALFAMVVLFGGLLGWARLHLKAHDLYQVAAGYFLGFTVMIIVFVNLA